MRRALLVALLLSPALARADVAPPSPADLDCPRGAVGRVQRGAERGFTTSCEPTSCVGDADCEGGLVCSNDVIGLCVEPVTAADGQPVPSARRRGCEPDGTCLNVDSTCEKSRRCVAPDDRGDAPEEPEAEEPEPEAAEEDPPAASGGCGCRVAAAGPSSAALLIGLLGLVGWRRR